MNTTDSGLRLRPIARSDLSACAALLMHTFNAPPWNDGWVEATARRYLAEFEDATGFVGYLAEDGSELTGAVFAHRKTWWAGDELYVDELFVAPERQGSGIGRLLTERCERHCAEHGLVSIILLTDRATPAAAFYRHLGFHPVDGMELLHKAVDVKEQG